ncbi:MAG: N-acetyltransferase [Flavobacterium sp.]|nr:MAG: N-acetyltransferase [Flavobacterium sp.]
MIEYSELETERLLLKPITPKIIEDLFSSKTQKTIIDFFQFSEDDFQDLKLKFEKGMETYRISFFYFLLVEKSSNQILGECGFHTWNMSHNRADIFYSLRNDHSKNKGYMTEALKMVLQFGFQNLNLHRVQALVASYNIPSLKLLKKFNFTKEGIARQDYIVDGVHEDSECHSLLKQEWQN